MGAEESPRISCRVHIANNTASATTFGHVRSSLKVAAAADVTDVSLILQVQHPDVAALEVTLTAAGTAGQKAKTTVKFAAFGAAGGANLVQTIFSDYAPSLMPVDVSVAPYSSVYRPAQPFRALLEGNGTEAGDGGSRGVWTLTVTDKADGDASRRPLKLTGWELWLCGETAGPLFAPDKEGDVAAFSGAGAAADTMKTVVKKAVPSAENVDVDVLVRAGYRAAQIEQDLITQAIGKVNTLLAKELAVKFDAAKGSLKGVNPQLASFLSSSLDTNMKHLQNLPATMGYLRDPKDGSWTLPTSEVVIKSFLDTLVHCYNNIYWCWENTGLRGNLALDFASTWDRTSSAMTAGWSAVQQQWVDAFTRFGEQYPGLSGWGDSLFYSVIGLLYDAAALDAVASVGEAYVDTAIRLAIFATPIRYVVNPRAFFTQLLILVSNILRSIFNAFQYVPVLVDGDTNNDVAAITTIASILTNQAIEVQGVLLQGVGARVRGIEQNMAASAGGLARSAADLSNNFGDTLAKINPALGAAFKAGADPIEAALEGLAASTQDDVSRYFKSQRFRAAGLEQELGRTMNLMGDVTVALARNTAEAMVTAGKALDDVLPGPPLQQVVANLTKDMQGILSDAASAVERVLPLPEIEEMRNLIDATITGTLDILQESAKQVQDSAGAAALRDQLENLAEGLNGAASGMSTVIDGIVKGFPGPLLNSTLAVIERQTNQTIVEIRNLFEALTRDYPNLEPKAFIANLGRLLDQLLSDVLGQSNTFESLASFTDVQRLAGALPGVLDAVTNAVPELQSMVVQQLPGAFGGGKGPRNEVPRQIDQGIGETLKTYAERVQAVAASIPNQPPLADITSNLQTRSQQLAESSNQLLPAVAQAIAAPTNVLRAGISDLNNGLTALLQDLDSQSRRAPELAMMLADGPLARVANGLNSTVGGVAKDVASAIDGMAKLLPDVPQVRQQLQSVLAPQVAALDATVSQASQQAVNAAAAASQGALLGLGQAMQGITGLLKDAQFQLAGLLGAAAQAGKSLNATVTGLAKNDTKPAPLIALDRNLAELGNNIARDVNNTLTALRPPIQVLEGVVRPLAATLNATLGSVAALVSGPVSGGLTQVLQVLQTFANGAIQGVGNALQLPLPPLPPLPGGKHDGGKADGNTPSPSPAASPSPSPSPAPGLSREELIALVDRTIRPTLNSLGVSNSTIDAVVNAAASYLANLGVTDATIGNFISQLPLDQLGFGNLTSTTQSAILQQLQPLLGNIQARLASGAAMGLGRGLLQDETEVNFTLAEYIDLVDSQIRPVLEAEGIDNAQIEQLVNSTASFLFSLEGVDGDVGFATRAAQDLSQLSPVALPAVQERLQPIIDEIQARTNGKDGKKHGKKEDGKKHDKQEDGKKKPGKPEKPEKPELPELPGKPGKDDKKDDKPEKPEKPGKDDANKDDDNKKPQLPGLPDFAALFTVNNLQDLVNGDGSAFKPEEFLKQVGSELLKALDKFAQELTGALLGAPGVSTSDGANQVLKGLSDSVRGAVGELEKTIASLPKGPVFDFLMKQGVGATTPQGRSAAPALDALQQLQQQLVSALDGAGAAANATSAEQLGELMRSASSALQSLAGGQLGQQLSAQLQNGASNVLGQSGQLVNQLANSLVPVSEAAGQMLQSFRENLSQMVMPLLGGQ
ncbi:hypothetical protein OEZ85_011107 [Tetradesmus obliquus]|uniref:P/Homo B domain-containing protein n=1 Tax=Tetradesmus obliquus TaxID=3088 RepID=A0ABY8TP98_TETOB|nr:hypothetical protein OEZ85_011107 [Tetradesmus obliquus]